MPSNKSYVLSRLSSVPANIRGGVADAIGHLLDNLRFGRGENGTRAENFQLYAIDGTTHATPDTEFSIRHGLDSTPVMVMPFMRLEVDRQIVPLKCTRDPDSVRIYLSSSVASADFTVWVGA